MTVVEAEHLFLFFTHQNGIDLERFQVNKMQDIWYNAPERHRVIVRDAVNMHKYGRKR
jgi:hypothetical protein